LLSVRIITVKSKISILTVAFFGDMQIESQIPSGWDVKVDGSAKAINHANIEDRAVQPGLCGAPDQSCGRFLTGFSAR